jgi:hypothetical protein
VRGHTLKQNSSCLLEADACRKGHNPTGGSQSVFGICSENAAPCYAVPFLEMRDVRAKSDDSSGRLLPRNEAWLIAIATSRTYRSMKFTPLAAIWISTSLSPGVGIGVSRAEVPRDLQFPEALLLSLCLSAFSPPMRGRSLF